MSFYQDMQTLATDLLTLFGGPVTFTRQAVTGDAETGEVTPEGSPVTSSTVGTLSPPGTGPIESFQQQAEENSLAIKDVRYLRVAAAPLSTFVPRRLDTVHVENDNSDWVVLGVHIVSPAGTPIVYGVGVVAA